MVSKARLDLPEPDSPVTQISAFRGNRTVMSLRLCSRAPWTTSSSAAAMDSQFSRADRIEQVFRSQLFAPAAPAPAPVFGRGAQLRPDRVQQDVAADRMCVFLPFD